LRRGAAAQQWRRADYVSRRSADRFTRSISCCCPKSRRTKTGAHAHDDRRLPDFHDPNRIQVIAVYFSVAGQWGRQTKDTFDWPALAALLK